MSPVSPPRTLPGVWLNVSQIDGPRPSDVRGALDLVRGGRRAPGEPRGEGEWFPGRVTLVMYSSLTRPLAGFSVSAYITGCKRLHFGQVTAW